MNNSIIIICARSGSKGIKNKNLKKIGGISLVGWAIKAAKKIKKIKKIIVSTDSTKIAKEAIKFGAEVPVLRPKKLSKDDTPEIDVWKHIINVVFEKYKFFPDQIISLPPTSPLRSVSDINAALKKFSNNRYDMIICAKKEGAKIKRVVIIRYNDKTN